MEERSPDPFLAQQTPVVTQRQYLRVLHKRPDAADLEDQECPDIHLQHTLILMCVSRSPELMQCDEGAH